MEGDKSCHALATKISHASNFTTKNSTGNVKMQCNVATLPRRGSEELASFKIKNKMDPIWVQVARTDDTEISFEGEIRFVLTVKHVLSSAEVGRHPTKQIASAGEHNRGGSYNKPSNTEYLC